MSRGSFAPAERECFSEQSSRVAENTPKGRIEDGIAKPPSRVRQLVEASPFILAHFAPLGLFWTGITPSAVVLCVMFYLVRMWGVTAGYHRYFSHRAFRTSRVFQFILAFVAQASAQRGAIWWAAHHRDHHRFSDQKNDVHSPHQHGLWTAHVGWFFEPGHEETRWKNVRDLERFPELRFLNRWHLLPSIVFAVLALLIGGLPGLLCGFFLSTVFLWHGTFFINSMAHLWGTRRFETSDDSRNNPLLAVITLGEGWHNNHHHFPRAARNGFRWWEFDPTYYSLRILAALRLVWDLKEPPEELLRD